MVVGTLTLLYLLSGSREYGRQQLREYLGVYQSYNSALG